MVYKCTPSVLYITKNMKTHFVFNVVPDRIDFLKATAFDKILDCRLVKSSKDSFFIFVIFSLPNSCIRIFLLEGRNYGLNSYIKYDIAQE
jgi:hypothetical protein